MIKKLTISIFILTLTSCASYVRGLQSEFEQQDRRSFRPNDSFALYRNQANPQGQRQQPQKQGNVPYRKQLYSTTNTNSLQPTAQRQYQNGDSKRVKGEDFEDRGNRASLWSGNDNTAYLFSNLNQKSTGDIIQINVLDSMKDEIVLELERSVRLGNRRPSKKDDKKEGEAKESAENKKDKIHDRITTMIVEEVNREHMLVRGRKSLIFKDRKRMIEIQALVARKDVSEDDTVDSDRVMERQITVLR